MTRRSSFNPSQAPEAWSRVPVDDLDYFDPAELLLLTPDQRFELMHLASSIRWNRDGWRNRDNCFLKFMEPEKYRDKVVMDFGCGLGVDALQFAHYQVDIILADLHPRTLFLAQQTLCVSLDRIPRRLCIVSPYPPFFLYSDVRWRQMMLEEPPEDTESHPRVMEFVRKCDTMGLYCDWYDQGKIEKMVQGFAKVEKCVYLSDEQFIGAVIKPLEENKP